MCQQSPTEDPSPEAVWSKKTCHLCLLPIPGNTRLLREEKYLLETLTVLYQFFHLSSFYFKRCDWVLWSSFYMTLLGNWEKPVLVFFRANLDFCIYIFVRIGFLNDFKDLCIIYVTCILSLWYYWLNLFHKIDLVREERKRFSWFPFLFYLRRGINQSNWISYILRESSNWLNSRMMNRLSAYLSLWN